ncbi:MAG TPA: hypothetical protein VHE99_08705 [Gammaproteobacteria bacterium]|nr:hypothetical protein [Gammaproteobacteria bacterium]
MRGNQVSLCYYPTTAILIDDQQPFLTKLQLGLPETRPYQFYANPNDFIARFAHHQPEHFINYCVTFDEDSAQENLIVRQVSLRNIHKEIYNPERFKQVSLLVADYAMPGHNGLECCDAIHDKYIQKLLLTGEAQNDLAVKAFNQRRINKFLQKSAPDLMQTLSSAIAELQLNYFLELSNSLRDNFKDGLEYLLTVLDDPAFVKFFYDLCESKQITEYYILDTQGSFLLLDDKAKAYWLLLKDETEMNNLFLHAEAEEAPAEVQDPLRNRSHLPYFHTEADLQTPPSQWKKYFYPAQRLAGQQNYYYTLLTDAPFNDLNPKEIKTVQQFLRESAG